MEKQELTCINCPMGCALEVEIENGAVVSVTGNTCPRGVAYAQKEVTAPTRIVCGTVAVFGGRDPVVSCKTVSDIPKGAIADVAKAMSEAYVQAPVSIGDVLVENIAGTGVDLVATHNLDEA